MMKKKRTKRPFILAINPGSTSTRLALFRGTKEIWKKKIEHDEKTLSACPDLLSQYPLRRDATFSALDEAGDIIKNLDAVVGRGGPIKPLPGGTYRVNEALLSDLKNMKLQSPHISFIGGILAHEVAGKYNCHAFITDPVSVDEYWAPARLSGHPEIPRKSLWHALNCRAAAYRAAKRLKRNYKDLNLIVVHLGSGITVSAHKKGRAVDTTNANSEAPFSPERCGTLPTIELLEWFARKGLTLKEAIAVLTRKGGLYAYLGTSDGREIEKRIKNDRHARLVFDTMAYQVGKSVGAFAAVLSGKVDAIVITGSLAYSKRLVNKIRRMTGFIAPVLTVPGENEMRALASAGYRVITGQERAKTYK